MPNPTQISGVLGADVGNATVGIDFELGTEVRTVDGRVYVLVRANGVVAASDVVLIDTLWDASAITTTNAAALLGNLVGVATDLQQDGVTVFSAVDNDFFWAVRSGRVAINVLTLAAANTVLNVTATAGKLDDDATIGAEVIDDLVILTAAGGATAAVIGHLAFPTVGVTL